MRTPYALLENLTFINLLILRTERTIWQYAKIESKILIHEMRIKKKNIYQMETRVFQSGRKITPWVVQC